jgi:hypothetical protein
MADMSWATFIARYPAAHLIAGVLPEKEGGGAKLRRRLDLLGRLLKQFRLDGAYALVIDREGSRPEIHCAFEREADARRVGQALLADITDRYRGWNSQRTFSLDAHTARAIKSALHESARQRSLGAFSLNTPGRPLR